jgi:hypothetical protein
MEHPVVTFAHFYDYKPYSIWVTGYRSLADNGQFKNKTHNLRALTCLLSVNKTKLK